MLKFSVLGNVNIDAYWIGPQSVSKMVRTRCVLEFIFLDLGEVIKYIYCIFHNVPNRVWVNTPYSNPFVFLYPNLKSLH